ncbi:sigma-54-dependent Fis family transcriptional regulator [Leminorella grimontii]|uniref:Sigma-54-dependent Fis family transcriptional regulator n=1 Tax=Leminorella grimontii TaxID=82981 RepID=A0AAV5N4C8_9GAMM|nr:sigma-54 dependent transcriptional regulator [Leminorella grimontii]KFC93542.1 FleQ family flagellar regulatory protein [Leminorella grimontii ATCC 33999 = DSM 5078]GKX55763.1 sigma-54-dependent Fis family transcriptional regulator [Leminorella grimontii]GKX59573.1 sigma-54-dependent Fis family transcriptional regulator [Leminorella grimontii]VFS55218.1 Nif-specific regulatory protein [Leminorella grimontii]
MSGFIAEASASIKVLSLAKRVASFNIPVLVQGETGTGKECIAKLIHSLAFPEPQDAPYIGVNCAAIPENMLEATLFGYEKGAFTGAVSAVPGKLEMANGGTLLLDEIGDMPLALQAKILRVLQEHQVERLGSNRSIRLNFRLIACTNKNLEAEVAAGRFREDLYYRLSVVPISIPPLRERVGDILPLAERFIQKYATAFGRQATLSESAKTALLKYGWPGNVRQLENTIQRGMILSRDGVIVPDSLGLPASTSSSYVEQPYKENISHIAICPQSQPQESDSLGEHGRFAQYQYIADLMRKYHGNRGKIADLLGITPRALRYRLASMRKNGIEVQFS